MNNNHIPIVTQSQDSLCCTVTDDFDGAYDLYHEAIFRYCFWKARDREVGQDLTQETFMRFYLCLQRQEKILNARAFLYRIAHNLFINHVRKKKEASLDQLQEAGFEPAVDPWHQTRCHLDVERPLKKLDQLEAPYRQVLHRRFILGLAPAEIATMSGETSNTVSVRIFRGLKHLRVLLKEEPQEVLNTLFAVDFGPIENENVAAPRVLLR